MKTLALQCGLAQSPGWVSFYSACDSDACCQRVLTSFKSGKSQHVFGDLCERVPTNVLNTLVEIGARIEKQIHEQTQKVSTVKPLSAMLADMQDIEFEVEEEDLVGVKGPQKR